MSELLKPWEAMRLQCGEGKKILWREDETKEWKDKFLDYFNLAFQYKLKPEKKYRPFRYEEFINLEGEAVYGSNNTIFIGKIISWNSNELVLESGAYRIGHSSENLLKIGFFKDGTPFGVEVEKEDDEEEEDEKEVIKVKKSCGTCKYHNDNEKRCNNTEKCFGANKWEAK